MGQPHKKPVEQWCLAGNVKQPESVTVTYGTLLKFPAGVAD